MLIIAEVNASYLPRDSFRTFAVALKQFVALKKYLMYAILFFVSCQFYSIQKY